MATPEYLLVVRPRRIRIYAVISASLVIAGMLTAGLLLRNADLGVPFQLSDQIGLIGLGLVIGGIMLLMARPRLRVDATGLWVRNVLGENFYEWPLVLQVAFPEGSNWAQLNLSDDETHAVMAIQSLDKRRAVESLRTLRELHQRFAPNRPAPSPAHEAQLLATEQDRPLGRLEIIDRKLAAQRERDAGQH